MTRGGSLRASVFTRHENPGQNSRDTPRRVRCGINDDARRKSHASAHFGKLRQASARFARRLTFWTGQRSRRQRDLGPCQVARARGVMKGTRGIRQDAGFRIGSQFGHRAISESRETRRSLSSASDSQVSRGGVSALTWLLLVRLHQPLTYPR